MNLYEWRQRHVHPDLRQIPAWEMLAQEDLLGGATILQASQVGASTFIQSVAFWYAENVGDSLLICDNWYEFDKIVHGIIEQSQYLYSSFNGKEVRFKNGYTCTIKRKNSVDDIEEDFVCVDDCDFYVDRRCKKVVRTTSLDGYPLDYISGTQSKFLVKCDCGFDQYPSFFNNNSNILFEGIKDRKQEDESRWICPVCFNDIDFKVGRWEPTNYPDHKSFFFPSIFTNWCTASIHYEDYTNCSANCDKFLLMT